MLDRLLVAPRAALAAPTSREAVVTQSAVVMFSSILSVVGAGWMIASFLVFPNLRTFRHQLILGLAVSDFVMAINTLLSTAMNLGGRWIGAPEQAHFCTFNGYMTQVFVIQTDYWVLVIAVYTYCLMNDRRRVSTWFETYPWAPWAAPWVLSVALASAWLAVVGYGDIGAWCWLTSDELRLYANFIQRWIIIAAMMLMYLQTHFVIARTHRQLASLQEGSSEGGAATVVSSRHAQKVKRFARLMFLYPLAYAMVWTLPTCIRIYQTASGTAAPWQLQTVDKFCVVIQGLVDAVIYGVTETSTSNWRRLLFPRWAPTGNDIEQTHGSDSSAKRTSRRWDLPKVDERQLVTRVSIGDSLPETTNRSDLSLEFGADGVRGGSDIELGCLDNSGSKMVISKTVDIEVVTSPSSDPKAAETENRW
ncbi:hypothetical protein OQA88_52 [Cercophora sp. LCS_1]